MTIVVPRVEINSAHTELKVRKFVVLVCTTYGLASAIKFGCRFDGASGAAMVALLLMIRDITRDKKERKEQQEYSCISYQIQ